MDSSRHEQYACKRTKDKKPHLTACTYRRYRRVKPTVTFYKWSKIELYSTQMHIYFVIYDEIYPVVRFRKVSKCTIDPFFPPKNEHFSISLVFPLSIFFTPHGGTVKLMQFACPHRDFPSPQSLDMASRRILSSLSAALRFIASICA